MHKIESQNIYTTSTDCLVMSLAIKSSDRAVKINPGPIEL